MGGPLGLGLNLWSTRPVGGGTPTPTPAALVFPAPSAMFDLDFANNQYYGGIQPDDTANANDGRFFRQMVTPNLPIYAENLDGTLRRWSAGAPLRRTTRGVLVEPEAESGTQPILWTNNLTNALWVKSNMIAAANQTSRSAVANSATLLTATAEGATCLYPVTLAASTRNFYLDIARVAGFGAVELTIDGVNWIPVALNKPRAGGYGRYGIPLTNVTNPVFGIRLGNNGDAIAVAYCTSDLLAFEASPWDQSGTGRRRRYDRPSTSLNGGTTTPVGSGLMEYLRNNATWGVYAEWDTQKDGNVLGSILYTSGGRVMASCTDGAGVIQSEVGGCRITTDARSPLLNKAYFWVTDGVGRLTVNGGPVVTSSGGSWGGYTVLDHKDLGANGSGAANMAGYIARLIITDPTLSTDAQKIAWTA